MLRVGIDVGMNVRSEHSALVSQADKALDHLEGLFQIFGPIIDSGDDVGMHIGDEVLAQTHGGLVELRLGRFPWRRSEAIPPTHQRLPYMVS